MPSPEVLIAGAGPAGALAALILARAGVRVSLVDRARFPRDKLCGDTVNPGAVAILRRLGLADRLERRAIPVDGMVVTGPGGVSVTGQYGSGGEAGVRGWALRRRDLDVALVAAATAAGAQLEEGVVVRGPLVEGGGAGPHVRGLIVRRTDGRTAHLPAPVTIAADGRRSPVATALGLSRATPSPRRWVVGGYVDGVDGLGTYGEMHVREDHYIGVAPLPGGLANVCVVSAQRSRFARPDALWRETIATDPVLGERCIGARFVGPPVSSGPMGVDATEAGCAGLLLAGDAAGFIDPITGDGLRFALRGGELAAETALWMLAHGVRDGHQRLRQRRAVVFGHKWRFNLAVRRLVASRLGVRAGAWGASVAPAVLRRVIGYAGDAHLGAAARERPPA